MSDVRQTDVCQMFIGPMFIAQMFVRCSSDRCSSVRCSLVICSSDRCVCLYGIRVVLTRLKCHLINTGMNEKLVLTLIWDQWASDSYIEQ